MDKYHKYLAAYLEDLSIVYQQSLKVDKVPKQVLDLFTEVAQAVGKARINDRKSASVTFYAHEVIPTVNDILVQLGWECNISESFELHPCVPAVPEMHTFTLKLRGE